MSINILKEFFLHFHTYRNVDLIHQGLYHIRARIYYTENSIKYFAIPYFHTDSKNGETLLSTDEHTTKPHHIITNHVSDNHSEYVTKTFLIRYSDEEVELDEFCYFRIEIPCTFLNSEISYTIEFELFFSDALMSISKEKVFSSTNILSNIEFKSVSQQILMINYLGHGGFKESFIPIIFSDNFSSILNSSVHMIVLDYKLRMNNLKPYTIEEGSNKYTYNTNIRSLIQFFMKEGELKLQPKVIDELYEKYVLSLLKNYISLRDRYTIVINKILDEKMKSEYPFFVVIQPLSVYFDEKDKNIINLANEENISYHRLYQIIGSLSARINDYSSEYIAGRILIEINYSGGQIYQLWHKYIELIRYFPAQTNYILNCEFSLKFKEDLSKFFKKSVINISEVTNLLLPVENNIAELNKKTALEIRKQLTENFIPQTIEIMNHYIKPSTFPIIFEEYYVNKMLNLDTKKTFYDNNTIQEKHDNNSISIIDSIESIESCKKSLCLHLIILVHGFQGNSYDMRMLKNIISLINPSIVFLASTANQDDTECDIQEMGKKLADEVRTYIKECNCGYIFKKLSFIGHSIGGLIIRSALPHLVEFTDKMWMYMSLSSPHLGYLYSSSTLVNAGMWLLKTWKKSKSLEQLSFSDSKEPKNCFIYKLSNDEGLGWFNYVYLISSHQDLYAPYESTRIQLCNKALSDTKNMSYNILSKITKDSIRRVDVNFYIPENSLDSFIGRTAHIQFLENQNFMKILFYSFDDVLKT